MDTVKNFFGHLDAFCDQYGDSRTNNWPLVQGMTSTLTCVAIYLYLVLYLGPKFMENRKPFKIMPIIKVYNILQLIACITIFYMIIISGWTTEYTLGCEPVEHTSPTSNRLAKLFWWTYMLKLVEFLETIFFILRKKTNQVSGLHVYHHASTFILAWAATKFFPGGMASFPILVNSFVHIVMYSYYELSSLGPHYKKIANKFKKYITMIQLIQFGILVIHTLQAASSTCDIPNWYVYGTVPDITVLFYLFYKFYRKTYNRKNKSVEPNLFVKNQ
ncbi:elongation of very long chain fatty acids protein AAEL008004-like [Daktulosphaira vitifoliae]|uniref:elongation of very long chain fatty acids protein AAEL008004-like n=1 Tax=Daktulosphaira vitifoliae TaxID=58002 RepID=UPI0021A9E83E|nr:elongation of very long chain fatty acids protein AAEL008004-like [Daktulosphaira vitifoliae]